MDNYYVNRVVILPHRTAPQSVQRLCVEFRSFDDFSEHNFSADLFTSESVEDIMTAFLKPHVGSLGPKVSDSVKKDLRIIAVDLIETVGENMDWLSSDTKEQVESFEQKWRERIFGNTLRAYGVTKRLTFDQALRVLQEHYIIEPVMES